MFNLRQVFFWFFVSAVLSAQALIDETRVSREEKSKWSYDGFS